MWHGRARSTCQRAADIENPPFNRYTRKFCRAFVFIHKRAINFALCVSQLWYMARNCASVLCINMKKIRFSRTGTRKLLYAIFVYYFFARRQKGDGYIWPFYHLYYLPTTSSVSSRNKVSNKSAQFIIMKVKRVFSVQKFVTYIRN